MKTATPVRFNRNGRDYAPLTGFDAQTYDDVNALRNIGIEFPERLVRRLVNGLNEAAGAMDSMNPLLTTPSLGTPVQFLTTFLQGYVQLVTRARRIDEIVGKRIAGDWEAESVIQAVLELVGSPALYGDYSNIPYSSFNNGLVSRNVVRLEEGFRVGQLESLRLDKIGLDSMVAKRRAAATALAIARNSIGFLGFNNGSNNIYGFLNDPNLLAYLAAPNGASGSSLWSMKTFLEIMNDILLMLSTLRTQSGDNIDPQRDELTLVVNTSSITWLDRTNTLGTQSVRQWLQSSYPKLRIISAPELVAANGGANVAYLFADRLDGDESTDGQGAFTQIVPVELKLIGVETHAKHIIEDYGTATAGVMVLRPDAVVRITGI